MLTSQRGLCKRSEDLWITHRDTLEIEGADSFFGVKPKVNGGGSKSLRFIPLALWISAVLVHFISFLISDAQCFQKGVRCKTDTRMCFYT